MASITATAALLLGIIAGASAQYSSILDAVDSNINVFSQLRAAAVRAGLASALANGNFTSIVFAPTNAAFAAANLTGLVEAEVIQYHIIPTQNSNPAVNSSAASTTFTTLLTGTPTKLANITVLPSGNGLVYLAGAIPGVLVNVSAPISAGLSTIYIIDTVIIPPVQGAGLSSYLSVAAAAADTPALSTLLALVQADAVVAAYLSNQDQAVTVFAPTNAAFTALLTSLNATAASLLGTSAARRILLNHVVPARPFVAAQLPSGTTVVNTLASPTFALDVATITKNASAVTVRGAGNTAAANVVIADVSAGKSVVHVIDRVLLNAPGTPSTSPPPPTSSAVQGMVNRFSLAAMAVAALMLVC